MPQIVQQAAAQLTFQGTHAAVIPQIYSITDEERRRSRILGEWRP
jgi:hypothetical protein